MKLEIDENVITKDGVEFKKVEGYGNSGDWNSGYGNSGDRNSGDGNSGYGNSTKRSSGIFCNQEQEVLIFNKPSNKKWDEIDHPDLSELRLCEWICEDYMTDQEKLENKHFFTTKGYLKKIDYKEAWAKFWEKTDNNNKNKILNLPNFDADIFEDITGIQVNKFCKKNGGLLPS